MKYMWCPSNYSCTVSVRGELRVIGHCTVLMMPLPDIWVNVLTVCSVSSPIVNTHHWALHSWCCHRHSQSWASVCVFQVSSPFKPMFVFFFSILKSGLRQKRYPEHCYMCIKDLITFLWVLFNYQDQVDYLSSLYTPLSFKSINLDPHLAKSRFSGMITSCNQ